MDKKVQALLLARELMNPRGKFASEASSAARLVIARKIVKKALDADEFGAMAHIVVPVFLRGLAKESNNLTGRKLQTWAESYVPTLIGGGASRRRRGGVYQKLVAKVANIFKRHYIKQKSVNEQPEDALEFSYTKLLTGNQAYTLGEGSTADPKSEDELVSAIVRPLLMASGRNLIDYHRKHKAESVEDITEISDALEQAQPSERDMEVAVGVIDSKLVEALEGLKIEGSVEHQVALKSAFKTLTIKSTSDARSFTNAMISCQALKKRSTISQDARETLVAAVLTLPTMHASLKAGNSKDEIINVVKYLVTGEGVEDEAEVLENQVNTLTMGQLVKRLRGVEYGDLSEVLTYLIGTEYDSARKSLQNWITTAWVHMVKLLLALEIADFAKDFYTKLDERDPSEADRFADQIAMYESFLANNSSCVSDLASISDKKQLAAMRRKMGIGVNMLANLGR